MTVPFFDHIFAAFSPEQQTALRAYCFPAPVLTYLDEWGRRGLSTPFASDDEFIAAKEVHFFWMGWLLKMQFPYVPNGISKMVEGANVDCVTCHATLGKCVDAFDEQVNKLVSAMKNRPRALLVCEKLKLSPKEIEAFLYIVAVQAGRLSVSCGVEMELRPRGIALYAQMTPQEILYFLGKGRMHMKQGLVVRTEEEGLVNDAEVWIPGEAVSAMCGNELTEEQLVKIDKTSLAVVLHESHVAQDGTEMALMGPSSMSGMITAPTQDSVSKREGIESEEAEEGTEESGTDEKRGEPAKVEGAKAASAAMPGRSVSSVMELANPTSAPSRSKMHEPYATDIEYIEDACRMLSTVIKVRNAESEAKDEDDVCYNPKNKVEASLRELKGKERLVKATLRSRMEATLKQGKFLPRIEVLGNQLGLTPLEKNILVFLVGSVVSHDVLIAINGRFALRAGIRQITVGYVLFVLCDNLQERVEGRKCFYRSAPLMERGLIATTIPGDERTCFNTDLTDFWVDIDRKMVDHIIGLDTQTRELVEGSSLYTPTVPMGNVVLPTETMQTVTDTIRNYEMFTNFRRKSRFGEGLGEGGAGGLVLLFYGPSGTGKTMLANGVACELHKKVLLVSLVQYKGNERATEILRFIFREAKLNDAIVFFDECESVFEDRESNPFVTAVLGEFERYDGLIILATNRAQILDDAMNRRISLVVEFRLPDHNMRRSIWQKHLPPNVKLDKDVAIETLALEFELSGGLIKNAVLAAMNTAVAREGTDAPTLRMADLVKGSKAQLRGFFQAAESVTSESYMMPRRSLADFVADPSTIGILNMIVRTTKSRGTLFSEWGFEEADMHDQGVTYLFTGLPGTGKSLAAEAIAYECGCNVRICNVSEMLLQRELNVQTIFNEAKKLQSIIVFDAAGPLFDYSERSEKLGLLIQYHAATYPRPVLVLVSSGENSPIDSRATPLHFTAEVQFKLPTRQLRAQLWRKFIPSKVPLAEDVNFEQLSGDFAVSAKFIRQVCFAACSRAALLPAEQKRLTMAALVAEANAALLREQQRSPTSHMFM